MVPVSLVKSAAKLKALYFTTETDEDKERSARTSYMTATANLFTGQWMPS